MKRSQSKWSSSTEERSDIEEAPRSPVRMAEGSWTPSQGRTSFVQGRKSFAQGRTYSPDNVLTRIRKAVSPPKNHGFQEMPTAASEVELMPTPAPVFLHNATSTQSFATTKPTRPTRSNRRPSQSNKRISKSRLTPAATPSIQSSSDPESGSKPKSPTITTPPSMLAGGASFELTPLSGLIAQSYTDIALLRRLHETQSPTYPSPTYSPSSSPKEKHPNSNLKSRSKNDKAGPPGKNTSPQVQQSLIDYDKVEDNLRKFEELYRQFLNYGGKHGDKAEEVHLVAVVCKRSDVVKGKVGEGDESVPRVQRTWVDCGF